jgi:hypothetical protein
MEAAVCIPTCLKHLLKVVDDSLTKFRRSVPKKKKKKEAQKLAV